MKIAILYICTGRYSAFWKGFYKSSEKYFLCNCERNYYVFTDSDSIYREEKPSVNKIYQNDLGWPGNTLFRFKIFESIVESLKKYDYIFFINANMIFVDYVGEEILPDIDSIIVTTHPGFYNKKRLDFAYEGNSKSLAYIPVHKGEVYVCGGFNGGSTKEYLELISSLNHNIQEDYRKGVIAIWHDESHLNQYIIDKHYKLLSPSYCYPQGILLPFKKRIIVRDKNNYGGHDYLRGLTDKKSGVVIRIITNIVTRIVRRVKSLI